MEEKNLCRERTVMKKSSKLKKHHLLYSGKNRDEKRRGGEVATKSK